MPIPSSVQDIEVASIEAAKDSPFMITKPDNWRGIVEALRERRPSAFTKEATDKKPVVTAIGAGNGEEIAYIAEAFGEEYGPIEVHINDTVADRVAACVELISNYPQTLQLGSTSTERMQTYQIPPSDALLAISALYYNADTWNYEINTDAEYERHFLTKVTTSLKPGGVFCVLLHSTESTKAKFENLVWPFRVQVATEAGEPPLTRFYADAESFEKSARSYAEQFTQRAGKNLTIAVSNCVSHVPFGGINFTPSADGGYPQQERAEKVLNFYTRGKFSFFQPEQQKQILDFIKENCKTDDGYAMEHINNVVTIQLSNS